MTDNIDKLFEPTKLGWLGLQRQKFRSNTTKEDPEFEKKYKQMKQIRENLKLIERYMINWHDHMNNLYGVASKLGRAVETPERILLDATKSGNLLLKSNTALDKIKDKINMIDAVLDQKSKLKYIRLKGDYANYKLEKLRKAQATESKEKENQKYLNIQKEATKQREHIRAQVVTAINQCVNRTTENGVSSLVYPQLQEFKLTQYNMFLNCQKLIQGREPDEELDQLESHWKQVKEKIGDKILDEDAGGGQEEEENAEYLKKDQRQTRVLSDFSEDHDLIPQQEEEEEEIPRTIQLQQPQSKLGVLFDDGSTLSHRSLRKEKVPVRQSQKHVAVRQPQKQMKAGPDDFEDSDFDGEDLGSLSDEDIRK